MESVRCGRYDRCDCCDRCGCHAIEGGQADLFSLGRTPDIVYFLSRSAMLRLGLILGVEPRFAIFLITTVVHKIAYCIIYHLKGYFFLYTMMYCSGSLCMGYYS